MSKNCWAIALTGLLLGGVFPNSATATRTVVPTGEPYIVDVWGIEDGLPQSSVISIAQTQDGYLWLGTLNGLVRFDGVKFTLFDEANTPGLNSSRIVHLFEDSRSNLWVGTESAGVALIKQNGETHSLDFGKGATDGRLVSACEDSSGTIWLLAANGLLGHFQNGKLEATPVGCKSIIAEKHGEILLGADSGLWARLQTTAGQTAFVQVVPGNSHLDFLLASGKGGFWRLADGRIQKWQGKKMERDLGTYPWGATPVMAACEDGAGNLIVGTYGDGVYWFDADGKWTRLANELSHPSILSLTFDREGNLWIGTNGGGLNRVKRKAFRVLAGSEGFVVQSVCEDGLGGLWIGYNGESRVDYLRDGNSRRFNLVPDPRTAPNCAVKAVFVDKDQKVWAGMWFSLSNRLAQLRDGRFEPVDVPAPVNQDVSVIYQDRSGQVWVGTQGGLAGWDGQTWKLFTARDGLPGNEVRALSEDAEGNLWIGTSGGLARWRDGHFTAFHKKDGLPSDDISCLHVDSEGALWVGTRGSGLSRFYQNRWVHYTTSVGLVGNSISYLLEDSQTNLWIGSNAGLMRVPKSSLDEFASGLARSIVCRTYVAADGLPTRECTQGSQPAACRTTDGVLWFPTTKGLVSVNPAALKDNQFQPPIIIESVLVEGQEQITNRLRAEPLAAVVVPPGKEHLEIHYTSLNLGAADRSRFRYRLEGHEATWTEDDNGARMARYTKLPPGDYRFQVAAANEDRIWNPIASILSITVKPPFWRTTGFLTASVLGLLGIIVAVVYYFSTQKLQRQLAVLRQQEELEKERARIARDLHDQLGANLMQVALLGDLAESDKHLPEEVESHARQISQTARETTKALDEIVWAVNPSHDTLEGLITYICKYAQEYFEIAGLRYRLEVPAQLPAVTIPPEVRHNVFLAAKEAVNNIVKHAQASEARLRLKLEPDRVTLELEDDGRGVSGLDQKSGRNGLRNMRKRLEDIGGSFSIEPAAKQGAVVRLSVPIKSS